jgi:hypothetical protein
MKNYLLVALLGGLVLFVSCGEDEEPLPPHEVGVWELDSYVFINFPEAFSRYEGLAVGIDAITFGGVTYEDYTLSLVKDGTASLEIGIQGPDLDDSGTWELDGNDLEIAFESGDIAWEVEKNEDDDLWLSEETQFSFIPNIYFDTVTQKYADYLETLSDSQLDSIDNILFQSVSLDLVSVFERQ